MRLNAGCSLDFEVSAPTPMILMLRPRSGYGQWVSREEYVIEPHVPVSEYTDNHGNLCQRLVAPEGKFSITATATVDTADVIDISPGAVFVLPANLPDYALQFLLPSRYSQCDLLGQLALEIVGDAAPGYDQVEKIRSWIYQNIKYEYGTSNSSTSAVDTVQSRVGVCRDFAHLGLALCRSLNIPARMVVGYLHNLKPMDLHAWFEAYVGWQWHTFDPTDEKTLGNRITIAYGRDAADVALTTQFGPALLNDMKVWVNAA
ncbi:MAG: transglutaminase family protein [Acidobacteriota bacterium]